MFFSCMVLEQGALSGRYDARHPMPEGSDRAAICNPLPGRLEPLNAAMQKLADQYGGAVTQILVARAIAKGTLPIIGVTKASHGEDAAKAVKITLAADEAKGPEALADAPGINAVRMREKELR